MMLSSSELMMNKNSVEVMNCFLLKHEAKLAEIGFSTLQVLKNQFSKLGPLKSKIEYDDGPNINFQLIQQRYTVLTLIDFVSIKLNGDSKISGLKMINKPHYKIYTEIYGTSLTNE